MEEEKIFSPFDCFAGLQETYEEAVKKSKEESQSFNRIKRFSMDSVGDYSVRILPIAPTKQIDDTYKLDRKGYEYPIKTMLLRLENPAPTGKKDKQVYVSICQSKYAGLSTDLIDTYINVAEDKYGNDEKLIKKIKSSTFEGGLKWTSQRCMYVLDTKKRGEGLQVLSLSYSQYKELEEWKLKMWQKLLQKSPNHPCPVSSIQNAYDVEIIRKEENKKTSYSLNIDTIGGYDPLSEEEVEMLLDAPRLPETLYRYSRFHLEATIEFLKQYDARMEMDVMSSKTIAEAIEKIKMELPADDKSHFSFNRKENTHSDSENEGGNDVEALWSRWEKLKERGVGDKSEEGQELRDDIRSFIDDNELSVRVTRAKTNEDLLNDIEDALENRVDIEDADSEDSSEEHDAVEVEEQERNDDEEEEDNDVDEVEVPTHTRGEHNDDTNEPAVTNRERRRERPVRKPR